MNETLLCCSCSFAELYFFFSCFVIVRKDRSFVWQSFMNLWRMNNFHNVKAIQSCLDLTILLNPWNLLSTLQTQTTSISPTSHKSQLIRNTFLEQHLNVVPSSAVAFLSIAGSCLLSKSQCGCLYHKKNGRKKNPRSTKSITENYKNYDQNTFSVVKLLQQLYTSKRANLSILSAVFACTLFVCCEHSTAYYSYVACKVNSLLV